MDLDITHDDIMSQSQLHEGSSIFYKNMVHGVAFDAKDGMTCCKVFLTYDMLNPHEPWYRL